MFHTALKLYSTVHSLAQDDMHFKVIDVYLCTSLYISVYLSLCWIIPGWALSYTRVALFASRY